MRVYLAAGCGCLFGLISWEKNEIKETGRPKERRSNGYNKGREVIYLFEWSDLSVILRPGSKFVT